MILPLTETVFLNIKEYEMKKKGLKVALMLVLFSTLTIVLTACGKLSEEEQKVVGKYELTSISVTGYPSINVNTYNYFTIEFFADRKCTVKSKAGTAEYSADATWKINGDGEIEVITRSGLAKATEIYKLDGDTLSGTNETVMDGERINMTVAFKRVVA